MQLPVEIEHVHSPAPPIFTRQDHALDFPFFFCIFFR